MNDVDLIKELGLWRWLVAFIVVSSGPLVNSLIREWLRSRKDKKVDILLHEIKGLIRDRYTESISLSMCDALLQPLLDNSARYLIEQGREIISANNLRRRSAIEAKISRIVGNMWSQNNEWLSRFSYHGHKLNEVINPSWHDDLRQVFIQSVYDSNDQQRERSFKTLEMNLHTEFDNMRFNTMAILQRI